MFRPVTEDFAVSPQISTDDVSRARTEGFTLIINNRPDGESARSAVEHRDRGFRALERAGLSVCPDLQTGPTPEQARSMSEAVHANSGRTLAFCRSGTRSIMTWALGELETAREERSHLIRLAAAAGYDLGAVLPER